MMLFLIIVVYVVKELGEAITETRRVGDVDRSMEIIADETDRKIIS